MIFMAAAPHGASTLLFEEEEAAILDATRRLPLDLVVEESGALARRAERMAEEAPVDILQLSCHGKAKPSPHLALEDERGRMHAVDPNTLALELGTNLPAHLLFLSACETADPYGIVDTFAAQMVRRGVPAVLGWGGSVRDTEAAELRVALSELLEGPCCDDAPILLVIDDAERLLDGAREGLHRVKPAFVDVLRSVIEAFDGADTASRLLLTSRYRFTLPHAGRDLAERLALVHLPPMSEIESRKQARAKERARRTRASTPTEPADVFARLEETRAFRACSSRAR